MIGVWASATAQGGRRPERLHELSHWEGFLEILRTRVNHPGFYLMDEPRRRCRLPLASACRPAAWPRPGRFPGHRRHPLTHGRLRPRREHPGTGRL